MPSIPVAQLQHVNIPHTYSRRASKRRRLHVTSLARPNHQSGNSAVAESTRTSHAPGNAKGVAVDLHAGSQNTNVSSASSQHRSPENPSKDTWTSYLRLNNILSYPWSKRAAPLDKPALNASSISPEQSDAQAVSVTSSDTTAAGKESKGFTQLFRRRNGGAATPAVKQSPRPTDDHPVLQLLQQRYQQGSKPGQRTDNFKLGLAVEGGGMRGAVTGGALMALLDLGLKDCFDAVYGSSAGAINSTYFLAEQREGVSIYHEDIANKEFVDLNRLMKGPGPVLDLDMLLHQVMHYVKPLDWDAVLTSTVPLKIITSSLDALQAVILDDFEDQDDLLCCLRSTANIPAICGPPVWHRGQRLVDAAVFEAIPFRSAVNDGCTHVLTLCSRPPPRFGTLMNSLEDALGEAIKRAVLSPQYMRPAWKREMEVIAKEGCTHDQQLMMGLRPDHASLPFFAGSHVCPIYPGAAAKFAPVCIDEVVLRAGVVEGYDTVTKVVGGAVRIDPAAALTRASPHEAGLDQQFELAR